MPIHLESEPGTDPFKLDSAFFRNRELVRLQTLLFRYGFTGTSNGPVDESYFSGSLFIWANSKLDSQSEYSILYDLPVYERFFSHEFDTCRKIPQPWIFHNRETLQPTCFPSRSLGWSIKGMVEGEE